MNPNFKVSIIIPSYNGGKFIGKAIRSALVQTHENIEVIVVDDGSTDGTKDIVSHYPGVIYHFQENSGVSIARNTGAWISTGDYLLFLDADDWLFSAAAEIHLNYFLKNPDLAMVSGCHMKMDSNKNEIYSKQYEVSKHNYLHMLKSNYIGPPAAAMFKKDIFLNYKFNEELKYCEDYELYLRVSKFEKTFHHRELIAAYFIHPTSVSASRDIVMMENSLRILKSILGINPSKEEKEAYKLGVKNWKVMYTNKIYRDKFGNKHDDNMSEQKLFLLRHNPRLFLKYMASLIIGK